MKYFIAFDLGATTGRAILGTVTNNKLSLKDIFRFSNEIYCFGNHYYWNIYSLYDNIIKGLKKAAELNIEITSIGIDTWGVDFACVGQDGSLLGLPYSYRDNHTIGIPELFFDSVLSRQQLYNKTGIQIMNFNSIFQLFVMKCNKCSQLEAASKVLFMPDVLSYLLTGNKVAEYTIASTSQLVNPDTKSFDKLLIEKMNINPNLFCNVVMPGYVIGSLTDNIARETGLGNVPVIAVASHDTASAIAAIPAENENFAYLSSGTWSLMGIESDKHVINYETYSMNVTNEGGVDGKICLLKNITGMWLLEQCLKEWKNQGKNYSYSDIVAMTSKDIFQYPIVDVDDVSFSNPQSMTCAIRDFCRKTSQYVPETPADFVGCIFYSLVSKYKSTLSMLDHLSTHNIEKLHIIGGGSKNEFLNQLTANATNTEVIAGLSEATAIGNIMIQARTAGIVDSLHEMRSLIAKSFETKVFMPE